MLVIFFFLPRKAILFLFLSAGATPMSPFVLAFGFDRFPPEERIAGTGRQARENNETA